MPSSLAQEVHLARRHEEILSQRSELLQQMETYLRDKKTKKTWQTQAADAARKRNAALLNDIEAAEKRLQERVHLLPHPDTVKLETRYMHGYQASPAAAPASLVVLLILLIAVLHGDALQPPALADRRRGLLHRQPVPDGLVGFAVQGGVQHALQSEIAGLCLGVFRNRVHEPSTFGIRDPLCQAGDPTAAPRPCEPSPC
uniref:Centrosomal protein 15 n=1 Tax=Ficedula albicollis TaxID=59894 RepID=A0A803W946_FICAL